MDFLIEHGRYLGIVVFLVLTGCGLPIPEEVPIILAGVFASQGELVPEWALAACLIGAILGDSVMYSIGYHFGHNLLIQHPKIAKIIGAEREAHFEQAIQRHGFKVMLLSRFMVGVRGPVYLAAGVMRIPYRKFLMYDVVCASLVVTTFFGLSYAYGEQIHDLVRDAETALTLLVLLVAGCVLLWWLRRRRRATCKTKEGPLAKIVAESEAEAEQSSIVTERSEDVA